MRRKEDEPSGGRRGRTLIPVSTHGCSAAPVIHICSLSGQFPQLRGLSVLTTTHRSSELILLLWHRTGDLGHAVMALFLLPFFLWLPKVMSTSPSPATQSDLDISQVFFHGGARVRLRACSCDFECVCVRARALVCDNMCLNTCVNVSVRLCVCVCVCVCV